MSSIIAIFFCFIPDASLEWETIEQYFLWQLIATHNIPTEHLMPILPKLEFHSHAEALTSIMIQLKQDWWVLMFIIWFFVLLFIKLDDDYGIHFIIVDYILSSPNGDLLRPLLCRDCKRADLFSVSVLKHWAQENEDRLADLLLAQLTKCNSTPNRKRK